MWAAHTRVGHFSLEFEACVPHCRLEYDYRDHSYKSIQTLSICTFYLHNTGIYLAWSLSLFDHILWQLWVNVNIKSFCFDNFYFHIFRPCKNTWAGFCSKRGKAYTIYKHTHKISHRSINFKEIIIQLYGHTYTTTCGKFIFEVCLWL